TSGGSTASVCFAPPPIRPAAASPPMPRLMKRRLESSMADLLAIRSTTCELHGQEAAVHRQLHAGDVGRLVGGQEQDRVGDLLHAPFPLQRDGPDHLVAPGG